ncbi:hypothetical protein AB0J52_03195 [Spirillospora sp. NPDC049652]
MRHPLAEIHRMSELVEPIATVTFSEVPNEAFLALGMRDPDGYLIEVGQATGMLHGVFADRPAPG